LDKDLEEKWREHKKLKSDHRRYEKELQRDHDNNLSFFKKESLFLYMDHAARLYYIF